MPEKIGYRRILLKISGETVGDPEGDVISVPRLNTIADEIKDVVSRGTQVAVVVGGGNIVRGAHLARESSIQTVTADYMGMLATVINALALQDTLEKQNIQTRVMSALTIQQVAEPFIRRRAIRHLEKGRVIILASGTGNPHFTTDTAASLKAAEVNAEILVKATTKVDGVYDSDPLTNSQALLYKSISYMDCINKNIKVMDLTAITLCMENHIPIIVFNIMKKGGLRRVVRGDRCGTIIHSKATVLAGD